MIKGFQNIFTKLTGRWKAMSKEMFWIVLGQVLAIVGSIVSVRWLTELMDPKIYGEVALGATAATLVNQLSFGPLGNGVMRFYAPANEQGLLGGYFAAVRHLVAYASIFIALLSLPVLGALLIFGQQAWVMIGLFAIIYAILSGQNTTLASVQNAARQRAIAAMHQGAESWVRFFVVIGLILLCGVSSAIAMLGYAIAVSIVLLSQYLFFRKIARGHGQKPGDEGPWISHMCKFSWPFVIWGAFYWTQSASDRWALQIFFSAHEVGLYSVLFQLGSAPMAIATGMALQLLAPIFYQRAGSAEDKERNAQVMKASWRLTRMALLLTGLACLVAWLLHEPLFGLLVANEYREVSYLLPWVMLASGLFASGQTIGLNMLSQMQPRMMMWVTIGSSITGTILNFVGAYFFGVAGVVFAGIVFSAMYVIWMAVLASREQLTQ